MKKLYQITFMLVCLIGFSVGSNAQTIWTGDPITFTKANYVDWTQAENQDRITDEVWITRRNTQLIFNAVVEDSMTWPVAPDGTLWAWGSIADGVETLEFDYWLETVESTPPLMVDSAMVLFLIEDSIYIDILFTSWANGSEGGMGGFSYIRSTGDASESVWTGEDLTFTKEDGADWTLPENQDRLTDNVWLTRGDREGLFNIVLRSSFDWLSSPIGTHWALGSTSDGLETLFFDSFTDIAEFEPPSIVNEDMVLHLIEEDIYIDIQFTSWTSGEGAGGGGFSYTRSTESGGASSIDNNIESEFSCYPNPANNHLVIAFNASETVLIEVFNVLGNVVFSSTSLAQDQLELDLNNIPSGILIVAATSSDGTVRNQKVIKE